VLDEKKLQKKIGWKPHKNQQKILDTNKKHTVICAGRRFGKSMLCGYVIVKRVISAIENRENIIIWNVAPTYDLSDKVFSFVRRWLGSLGFLTKSKARISNKPPQKIVLGSNQIRIECKSATEPNSLLGEAVDLLIVDECSRINKNVYEQNLRPTTTDKPNSRTFFISTPFGKNWFYEYWMRADKPEEKDMVAFHFTSKDNPYWHAWDEEKRVLPEDVFNQEYAARFLEGAGTVFRGVANCVEPKLNEGVPPKLGHRYVMGLDLAKLRDFTVITIVDRQTHEVVFWDRFNRLPYTLQTQRIVKAAEAYHAKIVMDSNNVGASIGDDLRAYGLTVQDFSFVGTKSKDQKKKGSKERIIEQLSNFIEEKNIFIPRKKELINELESFSYVLSDSGNLKYAAPTGLNDDCVDSLALAVWDLKGKKKLENIAIKKSFPKKRRRFPYR